MNGMNEVKTGYQPVPESTVKTIAGSAILESIGAIATTALAVIGLVGVFSPTLMAAIATIVLGAAIWLEGGAFATNYGQIALREGLPSRHLERGEGLTADFLGGLTGMVLGVLALLGLAPMTLLSVATLVFGATFLFSSRVSLRSSQSAFGLVAWVLGLLAVVGISPLTLVLIALACLGASGLLDGLLASAKATATTPKAA
jgi:hypothetical protein